MKDTTGMTAIEYLLHLHYCEQEGISSGMPTPQQWIDAVEAARKEYAQLKLKEQQEKEPETVAWPFIMDGYEIKIIPSALMGEKGLGKLYIHPDDYKPQLIRKNP